MNMINDCIDAWLSKYAEAEKNRLGQQLNQIQAQSTKKNTPESEESLNRNKKISNRINYSSQSDLVLRRLKRQLLRITGISVAVGVVYTNGGDQLVKNISGQAGVIMNEKSK